MASRHDAVLAAIPALVLSGVVAGAAARRLGVAGASVAGVPSWVVGFVAALALIWRELTVVAARAS